MKKYIIIFVASFVVFLGILGGSYLYLNNAEAKMQDPHFDDITSENIDLAPPGAENETVINTLLLGVDDARSDTMMVARYNKETNKVALISIPRDTRVEIPGYGYTKINAAVGKSEGTALAMKTASNFLDIPIHHYIKVDFKGVEKIVDTIGGIEINVPIKMDYDDPTQDLHIHIPKGIQKLDGKQSLNFLRYRSGYADQDLGRIKAQQEFAKLFIKKLTSPAMILKAPSLLNTMLQSTKTNLEQDEIAAYIMDIGKVNTEDIKMYTIPGEGGMLNQVAYFLHNQTKLQEMMMKMDEELGVEKQDDQMVNNVPVTSPQNTTIEKDQIKIEILNSTKTKGLALRMKQELEQKGFKVGKIGDTKDMIYNHSRVIDRHGHNDKLQMISKETGIKVIDSDINESYDYDITIILGNDRN